MNSCLYYLQTYDIKHTNSDAIKYKLQNTRKISKQQYITRRTLFCQL